MSADEPSSLTSSLKAERSLLSASAIRALAEENWSRSRPWIDWPLLVVFVILMTALFAPLGAPSFSVPAPDTIAPKTIRADRNLVVEDEAATTLQRQRVAGAVRPRFDYEPDLLFARRDRAVAAIERIGERKAAGEHDVATRRQMFEAELGQPVNAKIFELLEGMSDRNDVSRALTFFLNIVADRMIVTDQGLLPTAGGIEISTPDSEKTTPVYHLGTVIDVSEAWRLMRARAGAAPYGEASNLRTWILETAMALVAPNLTPDEVATGAVRAEAAAAVEPVMTRIGRGEVLVREGDRITPQALARIRALNEATTGGLGWVDSLAFAALLVGLIGLGTFFFRRAREAFPLNRKSGYITVAAVIITGLACLAALYAGRGITEGFGVDTRAAAFLCPVALGTVIVALLVNARASLMVGVALSLLVAYRADGDIWLASHYLIGVLVAGIVARRCRHRSDLLKVGLAVALAQAGTSQATLVLSGVAVGPDYLMVALFALAAGGLVAVIAMGLLPLFEYVFDEVTDVRLMELASGDHPLLKRLALHSPGTYHHSVMIANLAEAAADAIGANALQCRVMALYHDIGKSVRPVYFAENQRDGNIHETLQPELSARIIFSHITEGIELARKYRLGRPVIDAITQHQGTTLLRVFYEKARSRARERGVTVDEEEFRYPGPRPMTRESGIIMLGDSVEAATRALKNPSPTDIRTRVGTVVGEKITDGQLADCALTVADLTKIEEAFTRVLILGVYHNRIEYPGRQLAADVASPEKGEEGRDKGRGRNTRAGVADRAP